MDLQTCRICIKKDFQTVSIFDKENEIQHSSKIMHIVNIKIHEYDKLPKSICASCVSELSVAYQFVKKCESSEKLLRSLENDQNSLLKLQSEGDIKCEIKSEYDYLTNCPEDTIDDFIDTHYSENTADISKNETKEHKKRTKKNKKGKMGPIQCALCGLLVNSQLAMDIHVRTHTGEKPYSCPYCDASFPAKGSMKRHILTYHTKRERKFTCETCGSSFYNKNDIKTHIRRHTGEKPYACPFCPKTFVQVTSLIRHKRTHTGDKPYSCPICEKKFADKSLLNKHKSVHSDEKKYICQLCNKAMKSTNSLRTHMALHTNEKRYVCNVCGISFAIKGNLKIHIERKHSDKSGQCSICLKTFSDLASHIRKHTGEKPFICNMCSKSFSSKRSLGNHVKFKHENREKYKCSIGDCKKTFPIGTMLEFHLLKYHTNHTPFICQHCGRGFFRTSDLSRHLRVTHMEAQPKPQLKNEPS